MLEARIKTALTERFPTDQRPVYTPHGFSGLHLFAWLYPESTEQDQARVHAWLQGGGRSEASTLQRAIAHVIGMPELEALIVFRYWLAPLKRAGVLGDCDLPCYVLPEGLLSVRGKCARSFTVSAIEPRLTAEPWAQAQAAYVLRTLT